MGRDAWDGMDRMGWMGSDPFMEWDGVIGWMDGMN